MDNTLKNKATINWIIFAVQAVISAAVLIMIFTSGLLPGSYCGVMAIAVLLLLVISFLFARSGKGAVRAVGSVLAVLISAGLVFGGVYVHKVTKTLGMIADAETQTEYVVVAVRQDDPAQKIEDTAGYSFGIIDGVSTKIVDETVKEIGELSGKEAEIHLYESPILMAQALLDGDIDAVIFNKAFIDILDDALENFSSQIRILYEKSFETDLADTGGESKKSQSLTDHAYTVLISGIDVNGPISTISRSDVNILMTVNPLTHKILLTTTPRDYFVYIPGISGDNRDKLTHAGVYGVEYSMKTLGELYGVDVSDYIRINFDSLVKLVDALGGVDVVSEYEFDTGSYHFTEGLNHMDGEQALSFSRARYEFADGDNQRGKNQMAVLTAIINKLQSPALLQNPGAVLDVVGESMQTSFRSSQITSLIAWQLSGGQSWSIERQAVTGQGDSQETFSMPGTNLYVMWPDEEVVKAAADKIKETMGE